jgi:hypothetical protein
MYTVDQINAALESFTRFSDDEGTRAKLVELILAGDLEVVGIVDGEFVWRAKPRARE